MLLSLFDKFGGSHGKMEKSEAEKIINETSAMMGYRWVEVTRPDLRDFNIKEGIKNLNDDLSTAIFQGHDFNLSKKPDRLSTPKQKNITANTAKPIINLIKTLSLTEWTSWFTIISGLIALWLYVIHPLIKTLHH